MDLATQWRKRSWWMNLTLLFCLYMTFLYMPFDIFWKSVADDEEVWFGITLHGWAAKLTAPLHWLIYGALAWGLWHMKRWCWPWAGVYCAQVAIAMLVWNLVDPRGRGLLPGLALGGLFLLPTIAFLRARAVFQPDTVTSSEAATQ
jgi:hypothetical protein